MPHKAGVFANTYIACASGSDSGAGGNRENVVSTTEAGGIDVCAGVSDDRMWRGGCTGRASARHVELDVLQSGPLVCPLARPEMLRLCVALASGVGGMLASVYAIVMRGEIGWRMSLTSTHLCHTN